MRDNTLRLLFVIFFINLYITASSQNDTLNVDTVSASVDTLTSSVIIYRDGKKKPEIVLSTSQAINFLQERHQPRYWNDISDPFRIALGQLVFEASHPPYDSSAVILRDYPYDSLLIPWDKFYIWEPLRLKVPVIPPLKFMSPADTVMRADTNISVPLPDSLLKTTLTTEDPFSLAKSSDGLKDTTILIIIDTLDSATSDREGYPFRYLDYPFQADSIEVAVRTLLDYMEERDSSVINFTGIGNVVTPLWINSKSGAMARYWLRNEFSDSVTVWIGNTARDTIGLYLEQGVNFRRPVMQGNYSDAKINVPSIDNSKLLDVQRIVVKPKYWKYRTESSLVLNQSALTNWVKGGENSIATALDITGYADYSNKLIKTTSNNYVRMKLGFLASGDNPIRKNLDLLETNSKLNHKAFGKFDFSGIMLFKTQALKGYNYPNDSVPVSKFMNPAILTIGFGLDYKPNKNTSLNFSPLSYKGTFVPDTANIDQTKYGIDKDKKSLNEPGVSFMISNIYKPSKNISITNRLQLFTNYINNPLNIDIDWETIVVANINWFTDVRINTHLIFDDDTKTVELDKDKKPVLRPDGTQKKTARIQFKEMIGFSLVFRF
jgi:hypothetical protein